VGAHLFQLFRPTKGGTLMFKYSGKISFETDQELTPTQLNQLLDLLFLQIVEPVDENQNDETFSTSAQIVTLDKETN
jgi:hypothetical protein